MKKYKVPTKRQPFFPFVKKILKVFYKKPKIINNAGAIDDKSIIVCNHNAKKGPVYLSLYFPKDLAIWGAHEMLGNYKSRFKYLRDIFYVKKRKFNKFWATILAAFEAVFSPLFYKGLRVLPTFQDVRILKTFNMSDESLKNGLSVLIFPEDSDDGYLDVLTSFHEGFIVYALAHYKRTGEDLPVYPSYYNLKTRRLVIDKPYYVNEMLKSGMSKEQIAELVKDKINTLREEYTLNENN